MKQRITNFINSILTTHFSRIERSQKEMQAQLQHIADQLADVKGKTATIITNLSTASGQIADLKKQLEEAKTNADDPAAIQAISDAVDEIDTTVTTAINSAQGTPAPSGGDETNT